MGEKGARLTTASEAFCVEVMERLGSIGAITSRKMFGGFGIFHDGIMFGIVSKTTLFFKVDDVSVADYRSVRAKQHKPMPYYSVPADVVSKKSSLHKWARTAIDVAHASASRKTSKK